MRYRFLTPPLALAAILAASAALAQATPPGALSDADALAAQMRIVAAEPTNVDALSAAGELSAKLGDLSGAASLFARADKANPRSGRVKAGEAEVLLRSERPGEALRYWNQAEGYGWPVARFAAERGLAYDLIGQQGRAQQDYRTALAAAPGDPEVTRRYALSLGISGQRDAALQLLDPLTRRGDRGAWRARAFVLAMAGDTAGADQIATSMMAPGQASGLEPFFARLATMGSVDRAFAVQYGEVRATPQRLADARLAPALPPMAPEIVPVLHVAAPVAVAATGSRRTDRRRGAGASTVAVAAASPTTASAQPPATRTPVQVATAQPARPRGPATLYYPPGSLIPRQLPREAVSTSVPAATTRQPPAFPSPAASQVALAVPPRSTPAAANPAASEPARPAGSAPTFEPAGQAVASAQPTPSPGPEGDAIFARIAGALAAPGRELAEAGERASAAAAAPTQTVATAEPPTRVPELTPAPTAARTAAAPAAPSSAAEAASLAAARGGGTTRRRDRGRLAETAPATPPATEVAAEAAPGTKASRHGKHITADTPETLATPPSSDETRHGHHSTDVAAADVSTDSPAPASTRRGRHGRSVEVASADAPDVVAPEKAHGRKGSSEIASSDEPATSGRHGRHARGEEVASDDTPAQTAAERRASARKTAAEKKAAAEKEEARKEAAEERRAERAEPKRYWVQVAGGANEHDLGKAWASAKEKSPELARKKGWTTPLRATNRVLAGPFKSDDEAREVVNKLKKQGVAAFQFTSEAGQRVSRLDEK